ncbi:ubiquitin-activating enzyme E1 1-like protein isoform X2, partial [Tanacetum coccineum]
IFTFPEDAATTTGAPFWSAPKRFPRPLEFFVSDLTHLNFVLAGSILRAETFGIPIPDWAKNPKKLVEAIETFGYVMKPIQFEKVCTYSFLYLYI